VTAAPGWRTSSLAASWCFPVRRLASDGLKAWAQVIERGYEGYVAKDEASVYEGGASSPAVDEKLERLEGPP
jgi:hypothetical protein